MTGNLQTKMMWLDSESSSNKSERYYQVTKMNEKKKKNLYFALFCSS